MRKQVRATSASMPSPIKPVPGTPVPDELAFAPEKVFGVRSETAARARPFLRVGRSR